MSDAIFEKVRKLLKAEKGTIRRMLKAGTLDEKYVEFLIDEKILDPLDLRKTNGGETGVSESEAYPTLEFQLPFGGLSCMHG